MQNSTANFDKTSTNLQNGIEVVCSTIVARRSKRDHWKTLGFIFGSSTATIFLFRFPLVRIPVLPSDMMFHKSPVIYFDEWFSFCISSTKSTILSLCCDWTAQTSASVVRHMSFRKYCWLWQTTSSNNFDDSSRALSFKNNFKVFRWFSSAVS